MKNWTMAFLPFTLAALGGCATASVGTVDRVVSARTVRFPGANYSALAVSNGLAVTCAHWSREDGGGVFDISSPADAKFLLRYPCRGYCCGAPVFFGDRCYVPNSFSITVLDVKDRAHPRFECLLNPQFPNEGGSKLWTQGGALYFCAGKTVCRMRPDGLSFDPAPGVRPPKHVSVQTVTDERGRTVSIADGQALRVGGHEMPFAYSLSSIAVGDGLAWVYAPGRERTAALLPLETGRGGLATFGPRVPATELAKGGYQTMGMQTAGAVTRVGNLLFADDGIAEITRRGTARFIRPRTRAASDMSVDGTRIAIAQCAYCRVLDFGDLAHVRATDFAPAATNPLHVTGCVLEGNRLYVAYTTKETPGMDFIYQQPTRGWVACFDASAPAEPLSVVETPACVALAKVGDYLYVTGRAGAFTVVDASDAAALEVVEIRKDLQLGSAYKVKRFGTDVFLMTGSRIVGLDVSDPAHPRAARVFERGPGSAAPDYDDFTVDGGKLYALAHASVDVFPLTGVRPDPIPDTLGVNGLGEPLEAADPALFAGHVAQTARPLPCEFQSGRFGAAFGAYVYDWVRLRDGSYAVAYGEAGVILCDGAGRLLRELGANPADGWTPVVAKAVLEKDGDVYVQDHAGRAFLAFRDVFAR